MNKNNYCVIMAGGIGSRFWPMSRTAFPKQFHDVLGTGKTLIQMTFERFLNICPKENIYVVTNALYKDLVLEQLDGMTEDQVLCEPCMRNTAPCIAYANFKIASINPDARIVVAPSDHLITNETEFVRLANLALDTAEGDQLVTLGIQPHRPDTGYGYICFDQTETTGEVKSVLRFEEKPQLERAKEFLAAGNYLWNSGIFIWSLKNIQAEFKNHLPAIYDLFDSISISYGTDQEQAEVDRVYPQSENISIDYGIMEKAQAVSVIPADFGWSDLGTWGSLSEHLNKDDKDNTTVGKVTLFQSENNLVFSANPEKLIAVEGLEGYIVVDTEDVLLVCRKESEQEIKAMVNSIKGSTGETFV